MTAAATELTPAARAYLRRATWGLPRMRQQEVWDELEEHLLTRAAQLQACGAAPPEALARALAELGSPARVSAGMTGVYLMPKLILIAGAGALALSAALYALAQQPAPTLQLAVQTTAPQLKCVQPAAPQPALPLLFTTGRENCYQDDRTMQEGIFLSVSELQKAMQATQFRLEQGRDHTFAIHGPMGKSYGPVYPRFTRASEAYLDLSELISVIINYNPLPVQLQTGAAPTFDLGNLGKLVLAGQGKNFNEQIYRAVARSVGSSLFDFSAQGQYFAYDFLKPGPQAVTQIIHTDFEPSTIVAAYQWTSSVPTVLEDGKPYSLNQIALSVGEVDAGGNVQLQLPADAMFVTAQAAQPGNDVLLLKLTNTPLSSLKSGLFQPN